MAEGLARMGLCAATADSDENEDEDEGAAPIMATGTPAATCSAIAGATPSSMGEVMGAKTGTIAKKVASAAVTATSAAELSCGGCCCTCGRGGSVESDGDEVGTGDASCRIMTTSAGSSAAEGKGLSLIHI